MTRIMRQTGMQGMKLARKLKGWNQQALADASGLDQSYISKVERGWDGATIRSLNLIAQALGVPIYQLFIEDTDQAELALLAVYRDLPQGRKLGWQDMALQVKAELQADDQ